MGALIRETISDNWMRVREMIERIDRDGDDAEGESVESATPLKHVIGS